MKVEYLTLPGWKTNTEEVRNFKDLPVNAQAYVYKIQELLGVPGKLSLPQQAVYSIDFKKQNKNKCILSNQKFL